MCDMKEKGTCGGTEIEEYRMGKNPPKLRMYGNAIRKSVTL